MGDVITNMKVRFSAETKEYKKGMKEGVKATEDLKSEAGGVFSKFAESIGVDMEGINKTIGTAKNGFKMFSGGLKESSGASGIFSKAMQIVKSALISTGIGAIVVAVGALIVAFTKFEGNADKLKQLLGGLGGVVNVIVNKLGKLGEAVFAFITLDFDGAKKKASEAFTGIGDAMSEAYKSGSALVRMQIDLEKATTASITANAKLNGEIERNQIIADDGTRSFAERKKAAEDNMQLLEDSAKQNVDLAKQEAAIADEKVRKAQIEGNVTRELLKEQAEAQAKLIEAENAAANKALENEKNRRELKQDLFEKDLDILIDGFDKQKTINEQKIADETLTLQERRKILEETVQLAQDSFDKQVETIQRFTGKNLQANELLGIADARLLNKKIRSFGLSEVMEGRLLEVINERKLAMQDLAVAERDLSTKEIEKQIAANQQLATMKREMAANDKLTYKERRALLEDAIKLETEGLNLKLGKKLIDNDTYKFEVEKLYKDLRKLIEEQNKALFDDVQKMKPLDVTPKLVLETDKLNKINAATQAEGERLQAEMTKARDFGAQLESSVESSVESASTGFGELLGQMALGTAGFSNVGQMVLSTLGDLAINVGKIAISTGIAISGIKQALRSLNPAVAVAAGVALVAIGTYVKGAISNAASGSGLASSSSVASSVSSSSNYGSLRSVPLEVHVFGEFRASGKEMKATLDTYQTSKSVRS